MHIWIWRGKRPEHADNALFRWCLISFCNNEVLNYWNRECFLHMVKELLNDIVRRWEAGVGEVIKGTLPKLDQSIKRWKEKRIKSSYRPRLLHPIELKFWVYVVEHLYPAEWPILNLCHRVRNGLPESKDCEVCSSYLVGIVTFTNSDVCIPLDHLT